MIATVLYLLGLLAAFAVGAATGAFFARRGEAERLDIALALRSVGEARRCPDHVKVPDSVARWNPTAYDADLEQWEDVARTCEFPLHDYSRREEAC